MIQPALFFALGFLCAGFLALLVAPAVWRRAVALTRRRIEASVPLTLSEIQADKDSLRAEFAMSARKLEMEIRALRAKAAGQLVEEGSLRKALSSLEQEREAQGGRLAELEKTNEAAQGELREREARIKELSERLAAGERIAGAQALEIERLGQMYDEASFSASNRQIELVARDSERETLSDKLSALRQENKALVRQRQEAEAQGRLAENALNAEKKKMAELDKKLQRMMATLADRDEKLDRREKELERLRRQAKAPAAAALREQMHELAAEVVSLTARLEGPGSPIPLLLKAGKERPADGEGAPVVSLAERIKALREAAPT